MESLASISQVFSYLLPILAVIALIVLIVVMINVIKVVKGVNVTVTKANPIVDGVNDAVTTANGYLKEFDTTVKAVNNMAMSVEAVRATTSRVVKNSADKWTKQYNQVKQWVLDALEKRDKDKAKVTAEAPQTISAEKPAEDTRKEAE
ncbi:MAG: hypothetical protein IJJ19_01530 [Erysipelotrichaceae bacterium]|nr:hypothetical protein [Erysipelotrichaceae bacterium]MBR0473657.1 hypothetical protein [Erysipelotrichaceae bacterium]